MLQKVLEWVYYILCMGCMVSLGEWTYHWTVKSRRKIVCAVTVYTFGFICFLILFPSFSILFYLFELLSWSMLCNVAFKDKVVKIFALFYVAGFVESMAIILVDIFWSKLLTEEILAIFGISITYLIFFFINKQNGYKEIVIYLNSISRIKRILIFLAIFFSTAISEFGNVVQEMLNNNRVTIVFRIIIAVELCAVIAIVYCMTRDSYQKKYYLEQNDLKEEYIRTQQEYYRTIYEKDKEMRSFRHDMASQIGLLQMFLEQGDLDSAKEHLHSISCNFEQASFKKVYVGEEMLDAILSMMNQKASEKNVQIEILGTLNNHNSRDAYDFCAIFSNALNNAIEACEKQTGEKRICVKILNHKQSLCVQFENPATEEMYQSILLGETTKVNKENHGYGIRNIRQAVERLNGSMEYRYKDGRVALEIYI